MLVHGLLSWSFCWRKNIPALAETYRVLALDLGGCGRSGALRQASYGIDAWSRQLEEFLDALELNKVHILASSTGGAVALDIASRCGSRVEKLALVSPVNPLSRRVIFLQQAYVATGMPLPVLRWLLGKAPVLVPWLFRRRFYSDPARITPETIPGYLEGLQPDVAVAMLREAIFGWDPYQMTRQLRQVAAPALLLWGEKDKLVPPSCIPDLAAALPNSCVVTIPEAGHLCFEELPEIFNREVLMFLREVRGTP